MKVLKQLAEKKQHLTDFYVLDTETAIRNKSGYNWNLEGTFIFGVIHGMNYTKVIHSKTEMINLLKDPRFYKKKVFMHNAEFDLNVLYGNVFHMDPNAIFNGTRFICATNGNCTFADSANIFVGRSVEEIGNMLGIKKPGLGNAQMISKRVGSAEINRCIKDCEIVYEALWRMFDFAGDIKITQASLSMTYFRRYHLPFNIQYNATNIQYFFNSYYGGRTEAFKLGKTHAKAIDANSMYPYIMKSIRFPNPLYLTRKDNVTISEFKTLLSRYEGCAFVDVSHPESWIGFLPYRSDKLLFPVGRFSGWYNFNELRFAIANGGVQVLRVKSVIFAPSIASPFVSFVDTLNDLKIKAEHTGNEFERDRAKRYSNSLYGKFGQRQKQDQEYLPDYMKELDKINEAKRNGTFKKLLLFNANRSDAFLITNSKRTANIVHSLPSFSSYITSGARIHLLEMMLKMERNRVVYCDTDSVFFELDLGNHFEQTTALGAWKLESKIITEIKGLKNYKYIKGAKEIWRVKGVPEQKGKKVVLIDGETRKEFDRVRQISEDEFEYYNIMKTKESLRRQIPARTITKRTKIIKGTYDKRQVFSDGSTKPIKLNLC